MRRAPVVAPRHPSSGHDQAAIAADARRLAGFITALDGFRFVDPGPAYAHMGALLTDAVLQAGIAYETVVKPRVMRVARDERTRTTTGFLEALMANGAERLLHWRGKRKIATLEGLARMLAEERVEEVDDLKHWLAGAESSERLRTIHGVGPKTIDYVRILAGCETVAPDVRIRAFLEQAGIPPWDYEKARSVVAEAARLLGVAERTLDHSIWAFGSAKRAAHSTRSECNASTSPPDRPAGRAERSARPS